MHTTKFRTYIVAKRAYVMCTQPLSVINKNKKLIVNYETKTSTHNLFNFLFFYFDKFMGTKYFFWRVFRSNLFHAKS